MPVNPWPNVFCCNNKRRGLLPGDVLVCMVCDDVPKGATWGGSRVRDVPVGWRPPWLTRS
jgi:hypothetical protein